MEIGSIIIGDEILSGKRQDKHFVHLIEVLQQKGFSLAWSQYLSDERVSITRALQASFALPDSVVFVFGGIGATPDDHTRQSTAQALGRQLVLHPEAERLIRERFQKDTTEQRLQLGYFPDGSDIIPNPVNGIPGFLFSNHYFFPGFPQMAWPMLSWVMETKLAHLEPPLPWVQESICVQSAHESTLITLLEEIERVYNVKTFSLPTLASGSDPGHIELGVKGPAEVAKEALSKMTTELLLRGHTLAMPKPRS